MLGDAYEYLIGRFAANAGKKAGEFYMPQQVSKILVQIVTLGKDKLRNVYDPTCGSGSLLLRVGKETKVYRYHGQERNNTTYNLARMNMLLHNVRYENFDIQNDDTLENPAFLDEQFDAVVANPPYSAKWSADSKFNDDDRFSGYGKHAPKSKADFAFIQHMVHYLDAVIGLPANIFYGTSIPTCILVFKKCRKADQDMLFIDASNAFEKGKNQNHLNDEHVEKIIDAYKKKKHRGQIQLRRQITRN